VTTTLETRWRIVGLPDWPNRVDVVLTVDTTAPVVVDAVERAADCAGVELWRLAGEGDRRCEQCGRPFPATRPDRRYCGARCGQRAYQRRRRAAATAART
jgi:hypothetical protein